MAASPLRSTPSIAIIESPIVPIRTGSMAPSPPVITPDEHCCVAPSSRSIPIQHHLHRTQSELQLYEDEVMADYRDYCMYQRIVRGMVKNQTTRKSNNEMNALHWGAHAAQTTTTTTPEVCNIIKTRHAPVTNSGLLSNTSSSSMYIASQEMEDSSDDDFAFTYESSQQEEEDDIFVLEM